MTESADQAGQFSNCRFCVERNYLDGSTYGSSASDRTHLAFAIAFGFDYFLTSGDEPSALDIEIEDCPNKIKVLDIEALRQELEYY